MTMIKCHFHGMTQLKARMTRAGARAPHILGQLFFAEATAIMADSKPLVPVDTGVLRGSGVVGKPIVLGSVATVEMGYGGPASDYALIQHENLSYNHTVGQAKYLEQPFTAHAADLDRRMVAQLDRLLWP